MIKEAGTYRARAVEVMLGESQKKGTPFVGVRFVVSGDKGRGEGIKWEGWLTSNTAERTLESLAHCGWTGDDLSVFANGDLHGLDRNEVDLVVEMEPYAGTDPEKMGNEYPKVKWVNRVASGSRFAGASMDVAKAAEYGKKFRGLAMSLKAKNGAAKAAAAPAPIDDDLPF